VLEVAPAQIEYEIEKTSFKTVRVVPDLKISFKEAMGLFRELISIPKRSKYRTLSAFKADRFC